jgi:hypothetical protein
MDRKELFFQLMSEGLSGEGFRYVKARNRFVRKDEKGNEFTVAFDTWEYFYMVETKLSVLITEIENIKRKAWGKSYDKFVTVGRVKSYLIDNPAEGQSLTDTEDNVRKAARSELDFYNSIGKEYFNRALDYQYLNRTLNRTPGSELYLAHNPIHTSFLAIIVSRLAGESDGRQAELFSFYRGIIQKHNPEFLEQYDLLVNHLTSV